MNGGAWKTTDKSCIWVVSYVVSSHALSATNIMGREAEECNCSDRDETTHATLVSTPTEA